MNPPIDTVTFDVWNTLLVNEFHDDRVKNARIRRVEGALWDAGFRFSAADVARAYDHSEAGLSSLWKREMDAGLEGQILLLLEGLGLGPDEHARATVRQPYSCALLDFKPLLVEGAEEALRTLKKKGYRIGLISNTGRTPGETMRVVLREYDILKYFDDTVFSGEVGFIKPNRRIFDRALRGLGARAENAVHIGDNMLLDVYGAGSAGMRSILFNRYSERFDRYAARYYDAKGRCGRPDATVGRLADVTAAIETLDGAGKDII